MPKARAKRAREEDERHVQLKAWLKELDAKEGLMNYYDALITEFDGDLTQIAAARIESNPRLESGGGMGEWTPNGISNLQILLGLLLLDFLSTTCTSTSSTAVSTT